MGMTLTEKIIANAAGRESVKAGENVWVNVNVLMTHDVCGPETIGIFKEKFGADAKVFDKENVVIIPDHYIFTEDKRAHRNIDILTDFAKEQDIPNYYQPGTDTYMGVCHVTLQRKVTFVLVKLFSVLTHTLVHTVLLVLSQLVLVTLTQPLHSVQVKPGLKFPRQLNLFSMVSFLKQ